MENVTQKNVDENHSIDNVIELGKSTERDDDKGQETENEGPAVGKEPTATRKDLQLGRRFFHGGSGFLIGSCYWLFFTHQRAIYLLGFITCMLYLLEQIRINYPKTSKKLTIINKYFLRGEEYLKESSAMPYAVALLLTIITFPQPVALVAIYTLAIGDPMSAIIGIKFGKHHIVRHKSVEGSMAFFTSCFLCCLIVLLITFGYDYGGKILGISFVLAFFATFFEMIPLKLDDNLTIPLFVAVFLWILCGFSDLPL